MTLRNAFGNLATDETVDETTALLRRIVKLLESQATVDVANRQKVCIDSITGSLTLTTLTGITNALPTGTNYLGQIYGQDFARIAFNTGIRSKITFS